MSEIKIVPGDKVYHLTLTSVAWVVEKIEDDLVTCSTLVKDTLELRRQKFAISSVQKIQDWSPSDIIQTRRNRY